MANQITLNDQELSSLEKKLEDEKAKMSREDRVLLEAVLAKANAEKGATPQGPGWTFTWTYRF